MKRDVPLRIREIARERVGSPPPRRVLLSKKQKQSRKRVRVASFNGEAPGF